MPLTTNNLNIQLASPLNHCTSIVKGEWSIGFNSSLFTSHWLPMSGTWQFTISIGPDLYLPIEATAESP